MGSTKDKVKETEKVISEAKGINKTGIPVPAKAEEIAKKGQEFAKKVEEEAKKAPAPAKTTSIPSQDDKAQEKTHLDALLTNLDTLLSEGAVQQKKSMYEEAIAIYNRAAELASSKKPNFSVFKKVVTEKEAGIFVRIA